MLALRPSQFHALLFERIQLELNSFIDYVTRYYPEQARVIGEDDLDAHLARALKQALSYGLHRSRDLYRFIDLVMLFGLDWNTPEHAWMTDVLTDSNVPHPARRLDALRYQLMERLEASGS